MLKSTTFTVFLISVFLGSSCALSAQEWQQVASHPNEARHHPVTFAIDGLGYMLTGGSSDRALQDFYRYDPVADEWTQLEDFPGGARSFAYGVAYEGKGYVGFGTVTDAAGFNALNDLWRYDPATDSWEQLADCRCIGRAHPAMVAVAGKVFVGLGNDAFNADLDDWWEYDIATNTWSQKPDFPSTQRHHPYYFDIDGMAYAGFGHHAADIFNDMYRYDPSTEEWERVADLPAEGRVAGTQFSYNGKGYVLSGDGDDHSYMEEGEFWEYDPVSDSWTALPPHPGISRWAPGSFVIDSKVFFLGGLSEELMSDMWVYEMEEVAVNSKEISTTDNLTLSPNPAANVLHVKSSSDIDRVEVRSMSGSLIMEASVPGGGSIDVSQLAVGHYVVMSFHTDGTAQSSKLTIAR